jgi:AcrR family transcriptional regulator
MTHLESSETPLDHRSDSRRNRLRLIEAARSLVAEKGMDVTAAEIAAQAEVGVGTLYRRFGSKDALIRDILADGLEEVEAVAQAALDDPDSWNGLASFFAFFSQTQVDNQGIAEYLSLSTSVPADEMSRMNSRLSGLVQDLVERAHREGSLRVDVSWEDVVLLSRASVSATECFGVYASSGQSQRACKIILDGMKTPTSTGVEPDL